MVVKDDSLGIGDYYHYSDYVGIGKRLACIVADLIVLAVGCVALAVFTVVFPSVSMSYPFCGFAIFVWLYLTVFKTRRWNLGYRLFGVRIVTLKGDRPSVFRMTVRSGLWVFGPFNLLMDLLWLGADPDQQSLRDCYTGTCVVRADAKPIGTAPIHMTYYYSMGFNLMYPRVSRPKAESS